MQVIAVGAEVVVHHVHQHHQPQAVGLVDQCTQLLGGAVGVLWRERQHAVVPPVALAGELPQRHQLNGSDAQLGQAWQLSGNPGVTLEQAHMQLLDHCLVPGATLPRVLPGVTGHIHHLARPLYAFRLVARGWVGHLQLAVDAVVVTVTGLTRCNAGVPAIFIRQQRDGRLLFQFHAHAARIGCPEGEARRRGVQQVCAMPVHLLAPAQ